MPLGVFRCGGGGFLCVSRTSLGLRYRRRRAFSLASLLASSRLRRESSPGTSTAASTGTSNRRRPRHRWGCLHHHRPPHRWRESPETSTASSYRWRRWLRRWQGGAFSAHFRAFFREGVILYLYRRKTAKTGYFWGVFGCFYVYRQTYTKKIQVGDGGGILARIGGAAS